MAAKKVPSSLPKQKQSINQIADSFIKSIGSTSKNEATKAVIDLLNSLHKLKSDSNADSELLNRFKAIAEQVLKLHRIPDMKMAIQSFLEANPELKGDK